MQFRQIQTPDSFVQQLGDFHDMQITNISTDIASESVLIKIEDALVNFEGTIEYARPVPAKLCFTGLRKINFQSDRSILGRIFECSIGNLNDGWHCKMHISPSSVLEFEFQSVGIDTAEILDFVQSI